MTAEVVDLETFRDAKIRGSQRFMLMPDVDALDDALDELPDDVVAFAFRRLVREFHLGRALTDQEASYKLHKHRRTVIRFRRMHGKFLDMMAGMSGYARFKFATRMSEKNFIKRPNKVEKSSNFWCPKPAENCEIAPTESDLSVSLTYEGKRETDRVFSEEKKVAPEAPIRDPLNPDRPLPTDEQKAAVHAKVAALVKYIKAASAPPAAVVPAPPDPYAELDARIDRFIASGLSVPQPPGWDSGGDRKR